MSTETKSPQVVEQTTATPSPIESQANSVLSELQPFLDPADKAAIEGLITGNKTPDPAANTETPPAVTPAAPNEAQPEETPEGTTAPAEGAPETPAPAEAKKSILGLNKKKPEAASAPVIKNPEDILSLVKAKYGQEYSKIEELPKFFESVDKMRVEAQKFNEVNKELTQFKEEWKNLPSQFHDALDLYVKGQDFTEAFVKTSKLDFTKPVEAQDIKSLVNQYFPNKFTEDDFEDPSDKSEKLIMAEEAAKLKYVAEKQMFDTKRATYTEKAQLTEKARNESMESSVKMLEQRFPEMDKVALEQVKSIFKGGPQKILSTFLNPDGTFKPDAGIKLMMAEYGESEISNIVDLTAHKVETEQNLQLLTRGAEAPRPVRNSAPPEQISPEIQKQLNEINGVADANKRTF